MHRTLAICSLAFILPASAAATTVTVTDTTSLVAALASATAGDVITLAPGTYAVDQNLNCAADGTPTAPIVVRAVNLGDATVEFDAVEGFKVSGASWQFENLVVRGVCADDSTCEHAFHVTGEADDFALLNSRLVNFNAHLKANGDGDPRAWPDRGLVDGNEFYNEAVRATANPVTPLDIVGGDDWVVRRNFIHDFAKGQGNSISYAAFLKGKGRNGLFERNLVACEHLHTGQIRLGLSFGGGGTDDAFCEGGTCTPEHIDGVMRNNIIANCPADVGIYVNEGQNVRILNNTLYNTTGIDLRFAATTATVANNVLDGRIRERDGATSTSSGNLELTRDDLDAIFVDPGALDFGPLDAAFLFDLADPAYPVDDDFCGSMRDAAVFDVGAIEYDGSICDTSTPFHGEPAATPGDMGSADDDMGSGGDDMGTGGEDTGVSGPDGRGDAGDVGDGGTSRDGGAGGDAGTSEPEFDDDSTPVPMPIGKKGCCATAATPMNDTILALFALALVGLRRRRSRR